MLRWPGDSQRESGRFAQIDSRESIRSKKKPLLRAIRANRLKPAIRNFCPSIRAIRKTGVQLGNPETIRENQAIQANLRIDSHESGHLSFDGLSQGILPIASRLGTWGWCRAEGGITKGRFQITCRS